MLYSEKLINKVESVAFWMEGDKYAQIDDVIAEVSKLTQVKVKYFYNTEAFISLPRLGIALKINHDDYFNMLFVEGYKTILPTHESSCFLVERLPKYKRIF